ncbi:LysM peptidoglycan-binding domain-containing protein [Pleomorphomonas koreensis]|uniref:LysM peptidoglycan-binding domain-containing protein n=1 Tax=Pleomorphomonas koreensis TaxID=257440 RepID=UPI0009FFDF72|nr:LysM peptidoglycan-binding domain-containing protein [Pleomorphomonas koreensis]
MSEIKSDQKISGVVGIGIYDGDITINFSASKENKVSIGQHFSGYGGEFNPKTGEWTPSYSGGIGGSFIFGLGIDWTIKFDSVEVSPYAAYGVFGEVPYSPATKLLAGSGLKYYPVSIELVLHSKEYNFYLEHKQWIETPPEVIDYLSKAGSPIGNILQGVQCFPPSTTIHTRNLGLIPISELSVGEEVLSFGNDQSGRGDLVPRRVTRLFRNITTEWVILNWQETGETRELTCTPSHHFLDEFGNFPTIGDILKRNGGTEATIVLADGRLQRVSARRVVYSAETAHLYERASRLEMPVAGGLALSPTVVEGWATYNFEVEDLHTYVAGGVRVHNDSTVITVRSGDTLSAIAKKYNVSVADIMVLNGIVDPRLR